jgi:CRP-like cAMP-binding protein
MVRLLSRHSSWSDAERLEVERLPHEIRFAAKGEQLVRPGRTEKYCHLLLTAFAHKAKFSGNLRRVVAINLPGEVVNTESVLALESDYAGEILRPGEVAVIPAAALRELAFRMPGLAQALWLRSQAEAAVYREWLLNDERRDLASRIAHLLCETDVRLQLLSTDGEETDLLPLDAPEIAQAVAAVQLYVERVLEKLQAAGAVAVTDRGVVVRDREKLAEIGDFDPQYIVRSHAPGGAPRP